MFLQVFPDIPIKTAGSYRFFSEATLSEFLENIFGRQILKVGEYLRTNDLSTSTHIGGNLNSSL